MLASIPTRLTADSTTASSSFASCFSFMSCWYSPIPMCCGSIFTSSDRGSCSLLAMDTAPRSDTSIPGSSLAASGDALYMLAPASFTTAHPTDSSWHATAMNCSVSRDAVPLPIATTFTPWRFMSATTSFLARACRSAGAGGWGNTVPISSNRPVGSTTASLQPVRKAGSTPRTVFPGNGGCRRRLERFLPKTFTALACASVARFPLSSLSMAGLRSRFKPSCTASCTSLRWLPGRGLPSTASAELSNSQRNAAELTAARFHSMLTLRIPAASPRLMAKI
mmetsp:Transcript_23717/g.65811  ORF Transcript_23717/g.65811 Transcript_23717/m.65811 type:complete len:280 (+) Transcript_23717:854-1693(+)